MLADRLDAEITRLDKVIFRRGAFYEDEAAEHKAYSNVRQWIKDDKEEADRIELEAMEAAEAAEEVERKTDPNYKTREMFKNVKITIPPKGNGR